MKETPFGVETFEFSPENADGSVTTQAGAHPFQLTSTVVLNAGAETDGGGTENWALWRSPRFRRICDSICRLVLVGNPSPFPQCTEGQFKLEKCPVGAQVGVALVTVFHSSVSLRMRCRCSTWCRRPVSRRALGSMIGGIPAFLDTSVRTGGDYGVTVSANEHHADGRAPCGPGHVLGLAGRPASRQLAGIRMRWSECLAGELSGRHDQRAVPDVADVVRRPVKRTVRRSMEGESWPAPGVSAGSQGMAAYIRQFV